jgi:micrococcal nuclease
MKRSFVRSSWILYLIFVFVLALLIFTLYPTYKGVKVKEVKDGDTIILGNGEVVRYIGMDTPERGETLFWEATKANQEMLKRGKITLEYDLDKQDDWRRTLAYVWVDSLMINAELIKNGLAWVYLFSPNLKYKAHFVSLQKRAREKKLGIWSIPVSPEKYYVATKDSRRFVFHRPDCKWANKIKSKNLLRFETRDQALDLGYSPCRDCKP